MNTAGRHPSSRECDHDRHERFIPGMLFGARYRIAGRLGCGGMGEVYAADDLELGQTVALKFLPESLTQDKSALAALRNEVRIARQISHPGVCRVYDIAEVDGYHLVTMEYVDGEDLASLLRRIGRLPREKATDIVGQLAAGLSAAHESGVLHRDLKPANVMIDGRGRVRIMDFGLAGFAEDLRENRQLAGTLAYMAPEQLAGKGPLLQSDVYSLGLVMYEVLTGRRAHEAASVAELRDRQASTPPSTPSTIVSDCDPAVERVVMWCLEFDPESRPSSALAVAAALPGGDPLAAAVAAGETPSPEMVAAAGGRGKLRRWVGASLVGLTILSFVTVALLNEQVATFRLAHLEKPPVVLADRAREILTQLGHPDRPADVAYGLRASGLLLHIGRTDQSRGRWKDLNARRPTPYHFWYREANAPLIPWSRSLGYAGYDDPPLTSSGMLRVVLDQSGRLVSFLRVPPIRQVRTKDTPPVDWSRFFSLAGLDSSAFLEVAPIATPPVAADERLAWEGLYPGVDALPVRIEAGASNGAPTYFRLLDTQDRERLLAQPAHPADEEPRPRNLLLNLQRYFLMITLPVFVLIPAVIAWKNVRARRGDLRSALRFATVVFALRLLSEALIRTHYPRIDTEMDVLLAGLESALGYGVLLGLCYLAAEPFLRRQWPDLLISWTRLVSGHHRNPLVGRDFLVGAAAGSVTVALYIASLLLPTWTGHPVWWPRDPDLNALLSGRMALGIFVDPSFLSNAMLGAILVVLFLLLFRRKFVAVAGTFLILTIAGTDSDLRYISYSAQQAVLATDALAVAVALFVTIRFGLLAVIAFELFYNSLLALPVTLEMSAWYATTSMFLLLALSAIALYAFHVSTRGTAVRERRVA